MHFHIDAAEDEHYKYSAYGRIAEKAENIVGKRTVVVSYRFAGAVEVSKNLVNICGRAVGIAALYGLARGKRYRHIGVYH